MLCSVTSELRLFKGHGIILAGTSCALETLPILATLWILRQMAQ